MVDECIIIYVKQKLNFSVEVMNLILQLNGMNTLPCYFNDHQQLHASLNVLFIHLYLDGSRSVDRILKRLRP